MPYENQQTPKENVDDLNYALKELAMLTTSTNLRKEYMKEVSNNPCCSSVKINTRYVSKVLISSEKCKMHRYKPYVSKVRNRTKSENNDNGPLGVNDIIQNMLDSCIQSVDEITQLKKAKSLESIMNSSDENVDLKKMHFGNVPELEIVSDCIQNLKVAE